MSLLLIRLIMAERSAGESRSMEPVCGQREDLRPLGRQRLRPGNSWLMRAIVAASREAAIGDGWCRSSPQRMNRRIGATPKTQFLEF